MLQINIPDKLTNKVSGVCFWQDVKFVVSWHERSIRFVKPVPTDLWRFFGKITSYDAQKSV